MYLQIYLNKINIKKERLLINSKDIIKIKPEEFYYYNHYNKLYKIDNDSINKNETKD